MIYLMQTSNRIDMLIDCRPENILYVCRLNPVTEEKDLEIIFSKFGPIKECDIVRDWKTGQSLQYAFIEFESTPSCEEAYLKMENAQIDDRRYIQMIKGIESMLIFVRVQLSSGRS